MTERDLLAGILADLKEEYLHMVYVAAKALHDVQTAKEAQADA